MRPQSRGAGSKGGHQESQYGLSDFWAADDSGHLPAVSFVKAPRAGDAHPGNSDPLDEQEFVVKTINHLESPPTWSSTAVVIAYDDSGGWYDHQMAPVLRQSQTPLDMLTGAGTCGSQSSPVPTNDAGAPEKPDAGCARVPRCWSSLPRRGRTFVDSTLTDQSSILRFIEDNWGLPRLGNRSTEASAGSICARPA